MSHCAECDLRGCKTYEEDKTLRDCRKDKPIQEQAAALFQEPDNLRMARAGKSRPKGTAAALSHGRDHSVFVRNSDFKNSDLFSVPVSQRGCYRQPYSALSRF